MLTVRVGECYQNFFLYLCLMTGERPQKRWVAGMLCPHESTQECYILLLPYSPPHPPIQRLLFHDSEGPLVRVASYCIPSLQEPVFPMVLHPGSISLGSRSQTSHFFIAHFKILFRRRICDPSNFHSQ